MIPVNLNDPIRVTAQPVNIENRMDTAEKQDKAKETQDIAERLENVASVSEDGDTVQVSPESNDKLDLDRFGKVTVKDQTQDNVNKTAGDEDKKWSPEDIVKEDTQKAAQGSADTDEEKKWSPKDAVRNAQEKEQSDDEKLKEEKKWSPQDIIKENEKKADSDDDTEVSQPVSTIGRTETQIKQMYLDGEISRNEFDRAVEAKEERKEELKEDAAQFAREAAGVRQMEDKTGRDAIVIKELFDQNSAQTPDPSTRADVIAALEDFAINQ